MVMRLPRSALLWLFLGLSTVLLGGCATTGALDTARQYYRAGNYSQAEAALGEADITGKDRVLILMERGAIRQASGNYDVSSVDFVAANDELQRLETYSLSKGAASMVVNDRVQSYLGAPYEWTLLHSMTALNHLALALWEEAAVEARRTVYTLRPEVRRSYPDIAFARYLAGFCFEMIGDYSNAELQYKIASSLMGPCAVDENTGRISWRKYTVTNETIPSLLPISERLNICPESNGPVLEQQREYQGDHELVCFVLVGDSSLGSDFEMSSPIVEHPPYVEFYQNGNYLGRSYNLTDTRRLAGETMSIDALGKGIKTASRIAVKEGIAQSLDRNGSPELALLTRVILIGMLERPDERHWVTLPRWLQVARVRCSGSLTNYDIVVKDAYGGTLDSRTIISPISKTYGTYVSILRIKP